MRAKRMIAGVLSVVLSLGLVNFSAISKSLASKFDGYSIDVEYAEDYSYATLKANLQGLTPEVELQSLADENGTVYSPAEFTQDVYENGDYEFTLQYNKTENGVTEEKTEKIVVTVDEIQSAAAVQPLGSTVAPQETDAVPNNEEDQVSQGAETTEDAVPEDAVSEDAVSEGAVPENAVPVETLQRSMAMALAEGQAATTISTKIYASDNHILIQNYDFEGGRLDADALPSINYRVFEKAVYKYNNANTEFTITGLYYYDSMWYYTTTENGDLGSLGYQLPANVGTADNEIEVRLYYRVESNTTYNITLGPGVTTDLYNMVVNGEALNANGTTTAKPGENVVIAFNQPSKFKTMQVFVTGTSQGDVKTFNTANVSGTGLTKLSEVRYTGTFTMPDKPVKITVLGVEWPQTADYQYGLKSGGATYSGAYLEEGALNISAVSVGNNVSPGVWNNTTRTNNTFGGTVKQLNYKDKLGNYSLADTAVGNFSANDTIVLSTRSDRYNYASYGIIPTSITLDVYVGVAYTGTGFTSYVINLPQTQNKTTTTRLDDLGVVVTVTCTDYTVESNKWGQPFTNFSIAHTITIEGMVHNFKVTLNNNSSTQQNFQVTKMDGIVQGDPAQDIADVSSAYYAPSQNQDKKGKYNLRLYDSFIWAEKGNDTSAIWFHIKPAYGYSKPKATLVNPASGQSILLSSNIPSEGNGKYTFGLYGVNAGDEMKGATQIEFVCEPISFVVRYNDAKGTYKETAPFTLADTRYYAIEHTYPTLSNGQYFAGFKLQIRDNNGKDVLLNLVNPKNNSIIWNSEDIIDVESMYNQIANAGLMSDVATTYRLVLEAQTSSTQSGSLITAKYQVKLQSDFDGYNDIVHNDANFTTLEETVKAYQGSQARLFGYQDVYTMDGKKYLLDAEHSTLQGRVENETTPFATLRYLLATQVQVDVTSLGDGNNGDTWNAQQANMWYNSSNFHAQGFDLNDIQAGTRDNQTFAGWEIWIEGANSGIKVTSSMMYGNSLNFYVMGVNDKATWQKIFDTGMFTLKATWRDSSAQVYSIDGSKENMTNDDYYIKEGDTSFPLTSTFQYGDSTVTQAKLEEMFEAGTLKIVLVRKDGQVGGSSVPEWQVRYGLKDDGTTDTTFGKPTITKEEGSSNFTVSFDVSKNVTGTWNDGSHFRIFAWTAANGADENLTATKIAAALTAADTAAGPNGVPANPYAGVIPSVDTMTYMLYEVKDSDGTTPTNIDQPQEIYDGVGYTLSATFWYNDSAADLEKVEKLIADDRIKIALLKKDPTIGGNKASNWYVVHGDGKASLGEPEVTMSGRKVTISFAVSGNVVGRWNDGASFRMLVWTDANAMGSNQNSLTAADVMKTLNGSTAGTTNPYEGEIPSVNIDTPMVYKVAVNGDSTSTVTVDATQASIPLSVSFKYRYDTNRYPNTEKGKFTVDMLDDVIKNKMSVTKLEVQKAGETSWTQVDLGSTTVLTADQNGGGIIQFTYNLTGSNLAQYDGAKFKISLATAANGSTNAEHTVTVAYISDPYAYVDIPKYVILDDNNSKVMENDIPQSGYAGQEVTVGYNETTMNAPVKPGITVKVQDGVLLKEGSVNGTSVNDMPIGIYTAGGVKIEAAAESDGNEYATVGTLSEGQKTLFFWMNVEQNGVKNQQYYAVVMFLLELGGTTT